MACKTITTRRKGRVKLCKKGGRWLFAGAVKSGGGGGARKGGHRKHRKGKHGCKGLKVNGKLKKGYSFVNLKAGSRCPKEV